MSLVKRKSAHVEGGGDSGEFFQLEDSGTSGAAALLSQQKSPDYCSDEETVVDESDVELESEEEKSKEETQSPGSEANLTIDKKPIETSQPIGSNNGKDVPKYAGASPSAIASKVNKFFTQGTPETLPNALFDPEKGDERSQESGDEEDADIDQTELETSNSTLESKYLVPATIHGRLEILIDKATGLINKDGIGECLPGTCAIGNTCMCLGVSDPKVYIKLGKQIVAATTRKSNTLNPSWQEIFVVDVCHDAQRLTVEVVDIDSISADDFLGQISFSVAQVVEEGRVTIQGEFPLWFNRRRVDNYKTILQDSSVKKMAENKRNRRKGNKYGWISLQMRFTQADLLIEKQLKLFEAKKQDPSIKYKTLLERYHPNVVPNSYFQAHSDGDFELYQSAHQPGIEYTIPPVKLGFGNENDNKVAEEVYTARSCWKDLYDSLNAAEHFICCCGWSVNPYIKLVRTGEKHEETLSFGELLKQKAEKGLLVFVMVWDDPSSNAFFRSGMLGTSDEEVVEYFKDSKVNCVKVTRRNKSFFGTLLEGTQMYTHHQKNIIVDANYLDHDAEKFKTAKVKAVKAFVGGIDITNGRYDDSTKSLFNIEGAHKDDFYQNCIPPEWLKKDKGPREPWQDIHASVTGAAAVDLLKNFIERWHRQAGWLRFAPPQKTCCNNNSYRIRNGVEMKKLEKLLKNSAGSKALPEGFLKETKQDIDALLTKAQGLLRLHKQKSELPDFFKRDSISGQDEVKKGKSEIKYTSNDKVIQIIRSADDNSAAFDKRIQPPRILIDPLSKHNHKVDNSMHKGYVHHIRHAKNFIYIESQYFIGSSHLWAEARNAGATNLIPAELAEKICSKIRMNEPFHAYVIVPLYPEGFPGSSPVKQILRFRMLTVQMIYMRIAKAIKQQGLSGQKKPTDYFSLFFLGKREAAPTASEEFIKDTGENKLKSLKGRRNSIGDEEDVADVEDYGNAYENVLRNRRFQIYVHSKLLVVDDQVAVIGSANINQRSFDGRRATDISASMFEGSQVATKGHGPKGKIYGFRISLWLEHLGKSFFEREDWDHSLLDRPWDPECIRLVQEEAKKNWETFVAEGKPQHVKGHLMRFPYHVNDDGTITNLDGYTHIPDFPKSLILGCKTKIPDFITT